MAIILYQGDALTVLQTLPAESVHCCVTSPPFWGLRDYGVAGQLGLEDTPQEYVAALVAVFSEVRRVLRQDGTLWLNLGDSYWGGGGGSYGEGKSVKGREGVHLTNIKNRYTPPGLKPKDLCGIPWRVAFALQADGWWLRSDIIWAKPNPMPESVEDRCTKSHEYIFMLTKQEKYFWDQEAVKEPCSETSHGGPHVVPGWKNETLGQGTGNLGQWTAEQKASGRNLRSVWTIATEAYPEAHFATYPAELPRRAILAGTSERGCCPQCGAPWERVVEKGPFRRVREGSDTSGSAAIETAKGQHGASSIFKTGGKHARLSVGWQPSCACPAAEPIPCRVLDPFLGSGTTALVAEKLGREALGIEISPQYVDLAVNRIERECGRLFTQIEVRRDEAAGSPVRLVS